MRSRRTRNMVMAGLLAAMGFLFMLIEFPLPLFPAYLKYDPGDMPALLASLTLGPSVGLLVELGKDILFALSGKSSAGILGTAANFVAGGSLVLVAGLVYKWIRASWAERPARGFFAPSRLGAVASLLAGTLAMCVVMFFANYYIFLPLWGVPPSDLLPLITASVLPFNLVKGVITGVLTYGALLRFERALVGDGAALGNTVAYVGRKPLPSKTHISSK